MASDDTSLQGTGDEIGRVDLGDVGELVFEDDGCSDPDTKMKYVDKDGDVYSSLPVGFCSLRGRIGDDEFADLVGSFGVGTGVDDDVLVDRLVKLVREGFIDPDLVDQLDVVVSRDVADAVAERL